MRSHFRYTTAFNILSLYQRFVARLKDRWKVEDEGPVSDLLNVEITRDDDGTVTLRQTAYIDRLASEFLAADIPPSVRGRPQCTIRDDHSVP